MPSNQSEFSFAVADMVLLSESDENNSNKKKLANRKKKSSIHNIMPFT